MTISSRPCGVGSFDQPEFVIRITPRGFTFIELLAVVFIVSLIATLIVVNIDRDQNKLAYLEARRFYELVRHVQDESILQGVQMGVNIDIQDNGYEFVERRETWLPISGDSVLRRRNIPKDIIIRLNIDQEPVSEEDQEEGGDEQSKRMIRPMIVIEPQGLTSSFEMEFRGQSNNWIVANNNNQQIKLSPGANND